MRNTFLLYTTILFTSACTTVSPLIRNELFIKNNVQTFRTEVDSIQTYDLISCNGKINPNTDIDMYEITGFNYHKNKGIVIGVGVKKIANISNNIVLYNYETDHIVLTTEECNRLLSENKKLSDMLHGKRTNYAETFYSDLKINQNLVISYEAKNGSNQAYYINLWVKGRKMQLNAEQFLASIQKFIQK